MTREQQYLTVRFRIRGTVILAVFKAKRRVKYSKALEVLEVKSLLVEDTYLLDNACDSSDFHSALTVIHSHEPVLLNTIVMKGNSGVSSGSYPVSITVV